MVDKTKSIDNKKEIELTCPECSYQWTFRGITDRATCTNCGKQFYIGERPENLKGYRVRCDQCGYEWKYTGKRQRATCPNCEQKIYLDKCRVNDDDPDISV